MSNLPSPRRPSRLILRCLEHCLASVIFRNPSSSGQWTLIPVVLWTVSNLTQFPTPSGMPRPLLYGFGNSWSQLHSLIPSTSFLTVHFCFCIKWKLSGYLWLSSQPFQVEGVFPLRCWVLKKKEKAMAPQSSTLAWKTPWMEEPGRLQSMRLLRVRHDWVTSRSRIGEGNGNPLQCSCLENPRDGGAWWAAVYGVSQSWTRLEWLSSSRGPGGDVGGVGEVSVVD